MPWRFNNLQIQKKKSEGKERKVKEGKKEREAPYWFTEEIVELSYGADHIASTLKRCCSNASGISKNC